MMNNFVVERLKFVLNRSAGENKQFGFVQLYLIKRFKRSHTFCCLFVHLFVFCFVLFWFLLF